MVKFAFQITSSKKAPSQACFLQKSGFDAVELMIEKADKKTEELLQRITNAGIKISAIGTGLAAKQGLTLTSRTTAKRKAASKFLTKSIQLANRFDSNIIVSSILGNCEKNDLQLIERELLKLSNYHLKTGHGMYILLESRNRYESKFLNTVSEIELLIKKIDAPNVGTLFDTFHANIEETSITKSLQDSRYLKEVHLSESNRNALGTGHIDFSDIFFTLKRKQFAGYATVELQSQDFKRDCLQCIGLIKRLTEK